MGAQFGFRARMPIGYRDAMCRCPNLAQYLARELLLVAAEMRDGSYYKHEPVHDERDYPDSDTQFGGMA